MVPFTPSWASTEPTWRPLIRAQRCPRQPRRPAGRHRLPQHGRARQESPWQARQPNSLPTCPLTLGISSGSPSVLHVATEAWSWAPLSSFLRPLNPRLPTGQGPSGSTSPATPSHCPPQDPHPSSSPGQFSNHPQSISQGNPTTSNTEQMILVWGPRMRCPRRAATLLGAWATPGPTCPL